MKNFKELFKVKSQCVWLARNEDGSLNAFRSRPTRHLKGEMVINYRYIIPIYEGELESGEWQGDIVESIPADQFPELTWASAPYAALRTISYVR